MDHWLVVWKCLEHVLLFDILGIIIPTDSYFSEGLKPPTSSGHTTLYNKWDMVRYDHGCRRLNISVLICYNGEIVGT